MSANNNKFFGITLNDILFFKIGEQSENGEKKSSF